MKRIVKFFYYLCKFLVVQFGFFSFMMFLGIINVILSLFLGLFGLDGPISWSKIETIILGIGFLVIFLVCFLLAILFTVWAEKLEEWIKKKEKQESRKRIKSSRYSGYSGGSYSGYSGYNRTLHDELDAAEYAARITDRYGQDWSGYDPEGPGLGPDPDSYYPSGYDPEAWNGPDITGL